MDKPTTKPLRRLQGKIVARLCNQLLEGSGLIVRDWQLPGTNPLPKHRRFTLETLDGDDWDEIPCIYELHQELQHDEEEKTQATG
ncbi:hypothetical protein [Ottowia cancrivicina]|jgi:hypothetical protein|uniref:hypothetical protein n=1 Tax=Ottowia cancrivicina TaxID=3040346 RepID=UPI002441B78B|nr:hypothetical protein [Ottowia sp. 10c7w1]